MNTTMNPAIYGRIIDDAERARREHGVDFARGSVRFEDGTLFSAIERLSTRYVAGEIDGDELTAAILASRAARLGR